MLATSYVRSFSCVLRLIIFILFSRSSVTTHKLPQNQTPLSVSFFINSLFFCCFRSFLAVGEAFVRLVDPYV